MANSGNIEVNAILGAREEEVGIDMKLELFRHATMKISFKGVNFLVDPILSPQGTMPAINNSPQPRANPLVDLPKIPDFNEIDAVLLTHTHQDHLDMEAVRMLPKEVPVYCQQGDEVKLGEYGFKDIRVVNEQAMYGEVTVIRTNGRHGTGDIEQAMGKVSGYVLKAAGELVTYIAGDTIWCSEVKTALEEHNPSVSVLFAGAAQFLTGGAITMTKEDVGKVCLTKSEMSVVAVHMEAFNHCLLTRSELRNYANENGFSEQLYIPKDGEKLILEG